MAPAAGRHSDDLQQEICESVGEFLNDERMSEREHVTKGFRGFFFFFLLLSQQQVKAALTSRLCCPRVARNLSLPPVGQPGPFGSGTNRLSVSDAGGN